MAQAVAEEHRAAGEGMAPYDLVIVGGGLVGASLACALGGQPLRVALVEAVPLRAEEQPSFDERTVALAYSSRCILEAIGLWEELAEQCGAIERIHVSHCGRFGAVRLDCRDEGVEALGYVTTSRALGRAFASALEGHPNLELLCPAVVREVEARAGGVRVEVQQDGRSRLLAGRLLVAADGGESLIRERLGIAATHWDYGQTAVVASVRPEKEHRRVAYERFTPTGPLAFLPLADGRCGVIWTVRSGESTEILGLGDREFVGRLQDRFGSRLGRLREPGRRRAYRLRLIRAREHVRPGLAIIGNAAHTLHPVAGQGFNLGLRDAATLAEVLVEGRAGGREAGDPTLLGEYARRRQADQRRTLLLTDSLARIFSNPLPPVVLGRGLGLLALERLPALKHRLGRQAMGLAGWVPRLARGVALPRSPGSGHG